MGAASVVMLSIHFHGQVSRKSNAGSRVQDEPHDHSGMANFLHTVAAKSYRHHAFGSPESKWLSGRLAVIKTVASALTLLLALFSLGPPSVSAQTQSVFKCIDRDGRVAFQDKPCASGLREQQVVLAPIPPPMPSPDYSRASAQELSRERRNKAAAREKIVYSYECRTQSGSLFYRHNRCPASIDRGGAMGAHRSTTREGVSASRIPRLDACRGMRSVGRDGRDFDEVPSTYDRNLGRDPCRKY